MNLTIEADYLDWVWVRSRLEENWRQLGEDVRGKENMVGKLFVKDGVCQEFRSMFQVF